MLSLFEPGVGAVPWLGPLNRLGSLADLNETTTSPFPVKSESLITICSIAKCHPTQDIIVGADAYGGVHVFKK